MSSNERYEYTEIVAPHDFRLLVLQPSSDVTAIVRGTLITTSLHQIENDIADNYTAISYVWGDADDQREIEVDNNRFQITASLDTALRHIRHARLTMNVWADGVCINQMAVDEKNTQVQQMGRIYETAQNTIIFLGELSEDQAVLEELVKISENATQGLPPRDKLQTLMNLLEKEGSDDLQNVREAAINQILQKQWFNRVWVLQELVLSANPWVQISVTKMRWAHFCYLLFQKDSDDLGIKMPPLAQLSDMNDFFEHHIRTSIEIWYSKEERKDALLLILQTRRGLGVKDPRDMIYANVGLVELNSPNCARYKELLDVDYGKTISEVYTDAALYLIKSGHGAGVLSHVEDVDPDDRPFNLPSWVPDWTSGKYLRKAAVYPEQGYGTLHTISTAREVLGCTVYRLGTIDSVREDMPPVLGLPEIHQTAEWEEISNQNTGDEWEHVRLVLQQQLRIWLGDKCQPNPKLPEDNDFHQWRGPMIVDHISLESLFQLASKHGAQEVIHAQETLRAGRYIYKPKNNWGIQQLLLLSMFRDTHSLLSKFFLRCGIAHLEGRGLAIVPAYATTGDVICVLGHENRTFVLRPMGNEGLTSERRGYLDLAFHKAYSQKREKAATIDADKNGMVEEAARVLMNLDLSEIGHFKIVGEGVFDSWNTQITIPKPQVMVLH